jgi:hypothetical protein
LGRKRFDHLVLEVSLAVGRRISRWELWMQLHEAGCDPEALTRQGAVEFCQAELPGFLKARGLRLSPREGRRLQRAVSRFDPGLPTPYDRMARI